MTTLNLNDISDNLYLLLFSLNKHIFNPNVIAKKFNIPHSHIKVLFSPLSDEDISNLSSSLDSLLAVIKKF